MVEGKGEGLQPVILVTNDDGFNAGGFKALIELVRPFGRIVAVAPEEGNSGMSHAITIKTPLRMKRRYLYEGVELYTVNGTPVDCVKFAMNRLFGQKPPDMLVSGINHGSNASINVIYSGTMAAALEGALYRVPSVGISLLDYSESPDFSAAIAYGRTIVRNVLVHGLPEGTCLNVNVPVLPLDKIRGVRVARQCKGVWREEFEKRTDPRGTDYYWLTGYFNNDEPDAVDTDEYCLDNGYVSVVPIKVDFTSYSDIERLKEWNFHLVNHNPKEKVREENR